MPQTMSGAWTGRDDASRFWTRAFAESDSLTSPVHYARPFAGQICALDDLGVALAAMAADPSTSTDAPVQVFVDGTRHPSFEVKILASPPRPGQAFEEWLSDTFGRRRFGIVTNNIERWSPDLAEAVALFATGLFEHLAWTEASVEISFITGNYDFTPFGVHCDGEDLFIAHLHLGPSEKRMFMWEPTQFYSLTGSRRASFEPELIIPAAERFVLGQGDVLLFPGSSYHIGSCGGHLSAALVLLIRRFQPAAVLQEAFLTSLADSVAPASELVSDWARRAERDFAKRRESNCGLRSSPVRVNWPDADLPRCSIRRRCPFKILTSPRGETLDVFVRGLKVQLPHRPPITDLVSDLGRDEWVSVHDLISRYSFAMTAEAAVYVISLLAAYGAITVRPEC